MKNVCAMIALAIGTLLGFSATDVSATAYPPDTSVVDTTTPAYPADTTSTTVVDQADAEATSTTAAATTTSSTTTSTTVAARGALPNSGLRSLLPIVAVAVVTLVMGAGLTLVTRDRTA